MYVIMREEDGAFVAPQGARWSYTADVSRARLFDSRERAAAECGLNEVVVPIGQARKQ